MKNHQKYRPQQTAILLFSTLEIDPSFFLFCIHMTTKWFLSLRCEITQWINRTRNLLKSKLGAKIFLFISLEIRMAICFGQRKSYLKVVGLFSILQANFTEPFLSKNLRRNFNNKKSTTDDSIIWLCLQKPLTAIVQNESVVRLIPVNNDFLSVEQTSETYE